LKCLVLSLLAIMKYLRAKSCWHFRMPMLRFPTFVVEEPKQSVSINVKFGWQDAYQTCHVFPHLSTCSATLVVTNI
jgi:hypothetical protein